MGEPRPELGVMADPEELIDALHALGAIRAPTAGAVQSNHARLTAAACAK